MKLVELVEKKDEDDTRKGGTYAGYRFNKDDIKELRTWAKNKKIPNRVPQEKFHCTLLYSRKPCPDYEPLGELEEPIVAKVDSPEIWDTQDEKRALVVRLNAPNMVKRHKKLMKDHDATYDFDEYKPHLTLSYDVGKDFTVDDLKDLKDHIGEIRAVEEYGEQLVDEWQKSDDE